MTEEEYQMMLRNASLCTLGLALAMSLNPGATMAQSHCKGLTEAKCSESPACKWQPAREGGMNKSPRKAHCRLDVKAAGEIAKKSQERKQ